MFLCMKKASLIVIILILICSFSYVRFSPKSDETVKWDKNKKLEYLIYGKSWTLETQSAEDIIAKKWGFRYKAVAGCLVTDKLVNSVQKHNEKVNQAFIAKFGKNWKDLMSKDFNTEFLTEKKAIALLEQQKGIVLKTEKLEKQKSRLTYYLKAFNNDPSYLIYVCGHEIVKGNQVVFLIYFKYSVDLKNSSVKLLKGTLADFD